MNESSSTKFKLKNISVFMEYPFFTMKNHSSEKVCFSYKSIELEITPGKLGLPSINDCDILIYCISKTVEILNDVGTISPYVEFSAYDFFIKSERPTCGRSYRAFRKTLLRLYGTQVRTNAKGNAVPKSGINENFVRFISDVGFGEKDKKVKLRLSDWLCSMIEPKSILTIDRTYFSLKPSEKMFYALIRKHLGFKGSFCIRLITLYKKMNIKTDIYEFRKLVKRIANQNRLPAFRLLYVKETEMLYAYSRNKKGLSLMQAQLLK